jgi:hypothetical protein
MDQGKVHSNVHRSRRTVVVRSLTLNFVQPA